jgi:hypothetical protein
MVSDDAARTRRRAFAPVGRAGGVRDADGDALLFGEEALEAAQVEHLCAAS